RVISALERLRDRSEDWFAGISAVDFTSDSRLVLSFASFEFQALVDPLRIEEALHTLETLTAAHVEKAMSARVVDLRYDGMIVLSYKPGSGASKTSAPKKSGSRKSSSKARKSTRQNSIKTG
ncbi:MAG: hypothetical protein ACE5GA_01470, partial [Candidatus Zixiibacteriota bacterium]